MEATVGRSMSPSFPIPPDGGIRVLWPAELKSLILDDVIAGNITIGQASYLIWYYGLVSA